MNGPVNNCATVIHKIIPCRNTDCKRGLQDWVLSCTAVVKEPGPTHETNKNTAIIWFLCFKWLNIDLRVCVRSIVFGCSSRKMAAGKPERVGHIRGDELSSGHRDSEKVKRST